MKYERFAEIWTTLVSNRAPATASGCAQKAVPFNNGVSEKTVDALVAEAEGDTSIFDEVEKKLSAQGA